MKVAVQAIYRVCRRTEMVDVSEDDISTLRKYKACPYKGKSDVEFVKYLPDLFAHLKELSDGSFEKTPEIAKTLYAELIHDDRTVSEAWSEAEDPVQTALVGFDEDRSLIAEVDLDEEYF